MDSSLPADSVIIPHWVKQRNKEESEMDTHVVGLDIVSIFLQPTSL
jgi:hypothetical protein